MNFKDLILGAKENAPGAAAEILCMYKPLLLKESIVDGVYDEDLYQELCLVLLGCIKKFRV
ncbi:MAG: helix-turn-helix domain-containing protein [Bacillota bacterium]